MLKKLTATKLILAFVLSLSMFAFTAKPADAKCQCVETAIFCYYSDGSWIIILNHPNCSPPAV